MAKKYRRLGLLPLLLVGCLSIYMVPGCNFLAGGFSTDEAPDDCDLDDSQPGCEIPDAGQPLVVACTPENATSDYSPIVGPAAICDKAPCEFSDLCYGQDRNYPGRSTENGTTLSFDNCWVERPNLSSGKLVCRDRAGSQVELFGNGVLSVPWEHDPAITWSVLHRSTGQDVMIAAKAGCGKRVCEMFSGFELDGDHRYFIGRVDQDLVAWYRRCMVRSMNLTDRDELVCQANSGRTVIIRTNDLDDAGDFFNGSWTIYAEPIDNGTNHVYQAPTPGCGTSPCNLWDGFELERKYRYMVLQSNDSMARWFDTCDLEELPDSNTRLNCSDGASHFIVLQTNGAEISDLNMSADMNWTLLRWDLGIFEN
ncbi:MAG: hypothetical protein JRJ87_00240 [Deltaproteobacteria bacterium]|nr:hypothetical protein [Deltaproteobacteria bacterium]